MLKQAILISLVAGAAAGAGSALLATTLTSEPAPKAGPAAGAIQKDAGAGLGEQLAALVQENQRLAERVRSLEGRALATPSAQRAPAPVAGADDAQVLSLEEKVAQLEAALRLRDGGMPKSLEVAVEDTLLAIEERKAAERAQEREAQRIQRTDERVEELTGELGLDAVQARELRNILLDESSRREAMMTLMREGGGDFGNAREEMGKLRDETNQRLAATLTPEQYDKYQETSQGFGRRGGGFGGIPGGNNGGGRGGRQRGADSN